MFVEVRWAIALKLIQKLLPAKLFRQNCESIYYFKSTHISIVMFSQQHFYNDINDVIWVDKNIINKNYLFKEKWWITFLREKLLQYLYFLAIHKPGVNKFHKKYVYLDNKSLFISKLFVITADNKNFLWKLHNLW